jgi:hypothetical protein
MPELSPNRILISDKATIVTWPLHHHHILCQSIFIDDHHSNLSNPELVINFLAALVSPLI